MAVKPSGEDYQLTEVQRYELVSGELVPDEEGSFVSNNEYEKLEERCDRYEKALTEIYNLHYCFNPTEKGKCGFIAHDALAAIGRVNET